METIYVITTLAAGVVEDPVAKSLSTVQVVSVLLGTLYPILVGLVTKRTTSASARAWMLAGLSAVSGFGFEFINSANFVWQQALLTSVVTFVTAVATHYGLWKPTNISTRAINVGSKR